MAGKRKQPPDRTFTILICILVLLGGTVYLINQNASRQQTIERNRQLAELYHATEPASRPSATPVPASQSPTASEPVAQTNPPTVSTTGTPAAAPTVQPTASPTVAPEPTDGVLRMELPTEPPINYRFVALLEQNPDTVGFLTIGEIDQPVVKRRNDNEYYLTHSFDGAESKAGTLFMDCGNLLVPEDDCLIIYGHNMKDNTMFGPLAKYHELSYIRSMQLVRFDTLYEDRLYVPFAVFDASMQGKASFDPRRFLFEDQAGFDAFIADMVKRSIFDIKVDVRYGDRILLLVTCSYNKQDGREIMALRALRDDETEEALTRIISHTHKK